MSNIFCSFLKALYYGTCLNSFIIASLYICVYSYFLQKLTNGIWISPLLLWYLLYNVGHVPKEKVQKYANEVLTSLTLPFLAWNFYANSAQFTIYKCMIILSSVKNYVHKMIFRNLINIECLEILRFIILHKSKGWSHKVQWKKEILFLSNI